MEVLHVRHKNYTRSMPTQCPRHMVTETDELSRALDEAAAVWPEMAEHRAQLLLRLVELGVEQFAADQARREAEREATVRGLAGRMTETWPADWKKELREEWPA